MTFKNAISLLGWLILALVMLFVAIGTSSCAILAGGVYLAAGILNLAAWAVAFVWYFKKYLRMHTQADEHRENK